MQSAAILAYVNWLYSIRLIFHILASVWPLNSGLYLSFLSNKFFDQPYRLSSTFVVIYILIVVNNHFIRQAVFVFL